MCDWEVKKRYWTPEWVVSICSPLPQDVSTQEVLGGEFFCFALPILVYTWLFTGCLNQHLPPVFWTGASLSGFRCFTFIARAPFLAMPLDRHPFWRTAAICKYQMHILSNKWACGHLRSNLSTASLFPMRWFCPVPVKHSSFLSSHMSLLIETFGNSLIVSFLTLEPDDHSLGVPVIFSFSSLTHFCCGCCLQML